MLRKIDSSDNRAVINLESYDDIGIGIKTFIISELISEITLTSNNMVSNSSIVVEDRGSDLIINIVDLNINSGDNIAFDLRGGVTGEYNIYLIYTGSNIISSKKNIGICISNNRKVDIVGENNGKLKVVGGTARPAIGNDYYTAGSGSLTFKGSGHIEVFSGLYGKCYKSDFINSEKRSYTVGFYNKTSEKSYIGIIDNVNLKIVGENGEILNGESIDIKPPCGGDGVRITGESIFENTSNGIVELRGGNGGICITKHMSVICGDGGHGISIDDCTIQILGRTILCGGNSVAKGDITKVFIRYGLGGSCINIEDKHLDKVKYLKISRFIRAEAGIGRESNTNIDKKKLFGINSGEFVNSNGNKIEILIEDTEFFYGDDCIYNEKYGQKFYEVNTNNERNEIRNDKNMSFFNKVKSFFIGLI